MLDSKKGKFGLIEKNSPSFDRLAVNGGEATVVAPIPQWPPHWPGVMAALESAFADGSWGQYHGRPVQQFVDAFSKYLGTTHVWPCSSGTIAVELALRGLGVTADHEVILGGYDFPGNFRAIEAIGARPVLVDVRENGYVIDASNILNAITPKTKVVIASHLHGQLADITGIRTIAGQHHIVVLEDACQVPGSTVDGSPAGIPGDAGVFSFGGSKLLTAGRGGAVVTRSDEVMQRIRISAERGNDAFPMSVLQAAVLTPQLETLDDLHQQRLASATRLRNALADSRVFRPLADPWTDAWSPAFFKFALQIPYEHDRQFLIDALTAEGVPVFSGFRGFVRRSIRRCDQSGSLENSKRAAAQTILLHHPLLIGESDLIDQVIAAFQKVEKCF